MINLNICLTDIPKEKIKTGKDGKKYLNISVSEMKQPDKFENTHTVFVKDKDDAEKTYIGKGKEVVFNKPAQDVKVIETETIIVNDDLPF
jgi:hypothetical protein